MPNWKKVIVSGSDATLNSLNLTNATAGATVFSIDGTEGRLFSITDELSGSLFAVSDISGIPSFEVFSDDTVKIGTHNSESIVVSGSELKLSHLSTQGSETDVLTINGSDVVGTRQLSSGAFATAYSLPLATSSARGGVKIGYTENGKNYPVELSSEKMYVNVPWTDNNTTYSVGDGGLTQNNFTNTLKSKLDGIAASANNYSLPLGTSSARGGFKIGYSENGKNYPVELSSEKMYVNVPWTDNNTTYSVGDGGLTQNNFTDELKEKLDGVDSGANAYSLPLGTSSARGGFKIGYTESGKNYPVELSSEKMYVNVPWTNTTYSVGDGGLTQKNFTTTLKSKLDGIAAGATNVTNNNQIDNGAGYITGYVNTVDMGDGFEVEDGNSSPTKVVITENKKLKFINGTGIDIRFTDSDNGSTSDPFDLTVSLGSGGVGAGTYGSTANGTKIDQITVDAYGRVTNVTTGATGTSTSDTNTTYLLKATQYDGGNTDPYLKLDANSGTDDLVQLSGGGATTVTRNSDGQITISSTDNNTTYSVGDGGLTQKNFTSTLKTKLDGIATSANNYSLPAATATTRGGVELFSNTVQSTSANSVSSTSGRTYGVQVNSAAQMVVNVPWSDTNTDTNTRYSLLAAQYDGGNSNPFLHLDADSGTDDYVQLVGSGATSVTRNDNGQITISSTDNNTTYSVGDGGLTQKNFTSTLKTKLDGIAASANNYSLPAGSSSTRGGFKIGYSENGKNYPVEVSSEKMYVNVPWTDTNTNTQLSQAQVRAMISAEGLVSYDEETGVISTSANNYSLPAATSTTRGGIELFSNTQQSTSANSVTTSSGRTYGLQVNSAGQGVVNVPWERTRIKINSATITAGDFTFVDGTNASFKNTGTNQYSIEATNTTYSADGNYGLMLSGTTFRLEDDRRRNSSSTDIKTGNTHDYTWYDADVGIRWYVAGAEDMRLQNGGTLQVDGDVVAYSTTISDERLKDNVTTIENPLDKIKALRGVEYDWNAGSRKGKRDLGLIAQEVEKVIPNIVHEHEQPFLNDDEDDKTLYKTVDYEKMVAVLIEGMKEQQSQIDELKSEINQLKGKV